MASTNIPKIYGSKSSKSRPRKRTHTSNTNQLALDKKQTFMRYNIEYEIFESLMDDNDYVNFEEEDDENNYPHDQVFPISGCQGSRKDSVFSPFRKESQSNSRGSTSVSNNFNDYLLHRSQGFMKNHSAFVRSDYGAHQMIEKGLYKETTLQIGDVNKVFCSQWLANDLIVMGTKCNQLLLYDVKTNRIDQIPCLRGHQGDHSQSEQCGIHAMQMNPSETLLATGAQTSNEIGIYRLPTLDPVCTGENAHCDWVFDLCWLDDQFLVSASRDKSLAMWCINENCDLTDSSYPFHGFTQPLAKKKCLGADKVRSLLFNPNLMEIVALSLNAKVHVWDALTFKQFMSQKLELVNENVCMAKTEDCSMYAVGSKSHVTLIDPRTLQSLSKVDTRKSGPNVRSISFRESLLTIGTGTGDILFYDVKAARYFEGRDGSLELNCSKCEVSSEGPLPNHIISENSATDSAIYTHSYDWSGMRLFAAGGPLSAACKGSYASLWS